MPSWICQECGYVYTNFSPPRRCPVCGARETSFEPLALIFASHRPADAV